MEGSQTSSHLPFGQPQYGITAHGPYHNKLRNTTKIGFVWVLRLDQPSRVVCNPVIRPGSSYTKKAGMSRWLFTTPFSFRDTRRPPGKVCEDTVVATAGCASASACARPPMAAINTAHTRGVTRRIHMMGRADGSVYFCPSSCQCADTHRVSNAHRVLVKWNTVKFLVCGVEGSSRRRRAWTCSSAHNIRWWNVVTKSLMALLP